MRVSANHFPQSLTTQISRLTDQQNRLQAQIGSGRRVTNASDDPVAMRRLLDLQAETSAVTQYRTNVARLQETSTATYNSLRGVQKVSDRAGEIATLANGLRSNVELQTYAKEVSKMIQQAVGELNGKQGDSYLFGGTKSDQPPFVIATDADGRVTSVTYQGNAAVNQSEVAAGVTMGVTIPGANSSGTGTRGLVTDSRSGADFFIHLISLQDNLLAGDTQAVADEDRPALRSDEENFIFHLGEIGATQSRLESAASSASDRSQVLKAQSSREGDADLADTLVKLSQTQSAYQATLQSAAKIMNLSLMDYLR